MPVWNEKISDITVIGKNYFSYLYSFGFLEQKRKVFIIDDYRVGYGQIFAEHIGELEKKFLQVWGHRYDVEALVHLEDYVEEVPITLCVGDRLLRLGRSSLQNLIELCRKQTDLFTPELYMGLKNNFKDFDSVIEVFCKRIAEAAFRFKTYQNLDLNVFKQNDVTEFEMIFEQIKSELFSKEGLAQLERRNFIYAMQAYFQGKISDRVNDFELRHLLISMLSPRYRIKQKEFTSALHKEFTRRGGHVKSAEVEAWQLYKGRPSSIQLSSYEGVIHPKSITYMGALHPHLPFKLKTNRDGFGSFDLHVEWNQRIFEHFVGRDFFFSRADTMGTDLPIWELYIKNKSSCRIKLVYPLDKGSKSKFYFQRGLEMAVQEIECLFPGHNKESMDRHIEVSPSWDEWVMLSNSHKRARHLGGQHYNRCDIYEQTMNRATPKVHGVEYKGVQKGHALGLFGFLMELKSSVYQ